jgi:hypothetical protein
MTSAATSSSMTVSRICRMSSETLQKNAAGRGVSRLLRRSDSRRGKR